MSKARTKKESKRNGRTNPVGNHRTPSSSTIKHAEGLTVVDGRGETTHILLPIEEYDRLMLADMVQSVLSKMDDPDDQFVDAEVVALEFAAEKIVAARKAAGLTQKQLGAKLKIPQSQISRIERNPDRTTVRTLKRIAKALKVDVSALV